MNGYTHSPNSTGGSITVTTATTGLCLTMNRWSFCPDCGMKLPSEWKHCAGCGKPIGAEMPPITSGHVTTNAPAQWTFTNQTERCAFDGLPPGAYDLVCLCPKCSPRC